MKKQLRCVCGHLREIHEHYRPGTDCGAEPRQHCTKFRPARFVDRLRYLLFGWMLLSASAMSTLPATPRGSRKLPDGYAGKSSLLVS